LKRWCEPTRYLEVGQGVTHFSSKRMIGTTSALNGLLRRNRAECKRWRRLWRRRGYTDSARRAWNNFNHTQAVMSPDPRNEAHLVFTPRSPKERGMKIQLRLPSPLSHNIQTSTPSPITTLLSPKRPSSYPSTTSLTQTCSSKTCRAFTLPHLLPTPPSRSKLHALNLQPPIYISLAQTQGGKLGGGEEIRWTHDPASTPPSPHRRRRRRRGRRGRMSLEPPAEGRRSHKWPQGGRKGAA